MTMAGDFMPDDEQGFAAEQEFPTVFGIRLTPTAIGIIVAVLGLGLAIYLFILLVSPKLQEGAQLRQQIAESEEQLSNPEERARLLAEADARVEAAEQLQADVLALFASEENLETLLLDLNARVQSVNAGIEDEERQAVLSEFSLDEGSSGVVSDGALGEAANNRLERRVYNVTLEGSYAQVQSILRNIERLQPLLVVQDFNLETSSSVLDIDLQGRPVNDEPPLTRITASFRLEALLPSDEPIPAEEGTGAEGDPAAEGDEGSADGEQSDGGEST